MLTLEFILQTMPCFCLFLHADYAFDQGLLPLFGYMPYSWLPAHSLHAKLG